MAKKKFYAVAKGVLPGVYTTWDACKAQVDGYSGAVYKSFTTEEDARAFVDSNGLHKTLLPKTEKKQEKPKAVKKERIPYSQKTVKGAIRSTANVKVLKDYLDPQNILDVNPHAFIAFVDGSYDKATKIYGSGIYVLSESLELDTAGIDAWDQWNIVGELEATKYALIYAEEQGMKDVFIYHDLINISLWASGEWQAKNEYTQEYVKFIEEMSKKMNIQFIKVKGHSGNKYNDIADKLAEEAIKDFIRHQ